MSEDKDNLAIRLANTERALFWLWSLIESNFSSKDRESVDKMMSEYFDINHKLGGFRDMDFLDNE